MRSKAACRLFVAALLAAACGGESKPAIAVWDLEGRKIDAMAVGEHELVAYVFVSTTCPISNRYIPTLERIGEAYEGTADLIAVYPDPRDTAERVMSHQREFGIRWPTIRDPDHVLVRHAGVEVTPEAAVFTGRGANAQLLYRGRIDDRVPTFGTFRAASSRDDLRDALERGKAGDTSRSEVQAVGCPLADLR